MAGNEKSRSHKVKMETLMQTYERINQEKEEKELEMRYRVKMLENTMPGLMMWNIWRMMMSMQGGQISSPSASKVIPDPTKEELVHELKNITDKLNSQNKVLQEMKTSEEESRNKLKEYESLMAREQILGDVLDQESDQDVELFEKLSKMAKERAEMDQKIKDLELKEKLYRETIEHADSFIAQIENKMDTQDDVSRSAKVEERDSISSGVLEEKVVAMDIELKRIRDELTSKEEEKQKLQETEKQLLQKLQETMKDIENMRQEIEGPLNDKIQMSKQRSKALEDEIKSSPEYPKKAEKEVSDVEFDSSEEDGIFKEREETEKELREELQQRLAQSTEMIDQEIMSAKGEFRFTSVKEMAESNSDTEDTVMITHIVSEHDLENAQNKEVMDVLNKWRNLMPVGLSNVPATQFQAFIAMIERDEDENQKPKDSSEDESTERTSTERLSRVYRHSKRCLHCSSMVLKSLEKFLEDVKELKEYVKKGDTMMSESNCSFLMQ